MKIKKEIGTCRCRPMQSSSGHSSLVMRPVSRRENEKGSFLLAHVTDNERFSGPYLFNNPTRGMLMSLHVFLSTLACNSQQLI
ncbi:hypothetical protein TNCV_4269911 [Trichonephila clavipes]|nr:hypothetical protein TNCV_4269911 [Trichonephila clavipes]